MAQRARCLGRDGLRRHHVGNASAGLCGGMVFAALDYWYAGIVPPSAQPAPKTPLYKFLVQRIIDSWHVADRLSRSTSPG